MYHGGDQALEMRKDNSWAAKKLQIAEGRLALSKDKVVPILIFDDHNQLLTLSYIDPENLVCRSKLSLFETNLWLKLPL